MIYQKIRLLRKQNNISQEELAKLISISRPTLSQIELGERKLKAEEVQKIANIFEISTNELLDKKNLEKKEIKIKDKYKMIKNLILYILGKCGQKPNIGEIVLNKLLYFCDFNYYELSFESISNSKYIKFPRGPIPKNMDIILSEMEKENLIKRFDAEYFGYTQKKAIPLINADTNLFNGKQIEIINNVINNYSDKNGKWITEFSHEDIPWKATENIGEEIEYGLVFYRSPIYSVKQEND